MQGLLTHERQLPGILLTLQSECPDLAGLLTGDDLVSEAVRKIPLHTVDQFADLFGHLLALHSPNGVMADDVALHQLAVFRQFPGIMLTVDSAGFIFDAEETAVFPGFGFVDSARTQ